MKTLRYQCLNLASLLAILAALLLTQSARAQANGNCPEGNQNKFIMPPNVNGGSDVRDSQGIVLADDFFCNQTGPITDIHIWGSWLNDQPGVITNFWLGIYDDVPASTNAAQQVTPSHPGTNLLWFQYFNQNQYCVSNYAAGDECFYDPPSMGMMGNDTRVFYYSFNPLNPFIQRGTAARSTNYWLAVYAQVAGNTNFFGWKTSISNYNDTAVWVPANSAGQPAPGLPWISMTNLPCFAFSPRVDLAFKLNTSTNTQPPPPCCPETNGMKYAQYPDIFTGVDYNTTLTPPDFFSGLGWVMADDFPCTTPGPVTDIHIWGSWLGDLIDPNAAFTLTIWPDVPTNAANFYSHPATNYLWTQTYGPGQYAMCPYTNRQESFSNGELDPLGVSTNLYYLCFNALPGNVFFQTGTATAPTNYWLSVAVQSLPTSSYHFGWKSSQDAYNDAAVFSVDGLLYPQNWNPTFDTTGRAVNLAFKINTLTNQCPPPQLICSNLTVGCDVAWVPPTPGVYDPCCAPVGAPVLSSVVTNSTCPTVIQYKWNYTNCQGQFASCSSLVTVTSPPPALVCSNFTVQCGSPIPNNPPFASHPCCPNVSVSLLSSSTNITTGGCGTTITRVWQAIENCCSNRSTCTQFISVVSSPTLLCSSLTINCGSPIPTTPPAYTDPCCTNVQVTLIGSTSTGNGCTQTVYQTWQATDYCCYTTNICTRTISILPSAPTLLCSNLTVNCGSAIPTTPPAYTDPCCTNVQVTLVGSSSTGNGCTQTVFQTWQAVDLCCGTSNTCTRTISVLPSAPTLLCSNYTVNCSSPFPTNPPAYIDNCCTNVTVRLINSSTNTTGCYQTIFQVWQALDQCCGSLSTCTQTVTVVPSAPLLVCSNSIIYCGDPIPTNPPAYVDNCCTNVNLLLLNSSTNNNGCSKTISRTWQLYDCCNNSAICTQVVSILPGMASTLVVPNANAAAVGGSGNTYPLDIGAGTQRYQQVFQASQFGAMPSGGSYITAIAFRPAFSGFAPTTLPAMQVNLSTTAKAPDGLNNTFANNVGFDDTVVFNGPLTLSSGFVGSPPAFDIVIPLATPFFYNPAAGNLLLDVRNSGGGTTTPIDSLSVVGDSVSRLYAVVTSPTGGMDSGGLVAQFTFSTAPVTLLCSNLTITCGSPIPTTPPAYIDNCCSNVQVTLLNSYSTGNCTQTVFQTWQATDYCCGATNICTRAITILPVPPTLLCSNLTIQCGTPIPTTPPAYIDNCCTNVSVTLIGSTSTGNGCTQTVYQTWQAVDQCCGLTNTCIRTISTLPSTPTLLCSNLTITCGSPIPTTPPAFSDPCCAAVTVTLLNTSNTGNGCTQTVFQTWQAVDQCCGTSNQCIRTITVLPAPPTLLCSNLTITCGTAFPPPPSYIDNCCTNVSVILLRSDTTGSGCSQTIVQTWQAVDQCCGMTNTCTRTINLLPSAPTLLCSNVVIQCGTPIPTNPPAYIDNCCTNVLVTLLSSTNSGNICTQTVTQVWQASDLCCNTSSTCARTITIVDTTPPTITCPSNIVLFSCSPATNIVNWTVNATDNCSGVSVVCNPPSGTKFHLGTTNVVHCVATDGCGNTNSCAFTVAVVRPPLGDPTIVLVGHTVTITWSGGGVLQGSDECYGPYSDITSTSPYNVLANQAHKFYRTRCVLPP